MRSDPVFARVWKRRIVERLLDLLFPPRCSLCDTVLEPRSRQPTVCTICRDLLNEGEHIHCPRCARPFPPERVVVATECPFCKGTAFRFSRAVVLGVYQGALREAVLSIKRLTNEPLALSLGELLTEVIAQQEFESPPDVLAPVPIHWTRRLRRGGNAPDLLVEAVARKMGIPAAYDLLKCQRKTRKQGTLLPSQRLKNVRGAFAASRNYHFNGAHVLVIDDVMTTGATMNEIARTLLRAGATNVTAAVVARGIGFDR